MDIILEIKKYGVNIPPMKETHSPLIIVDPTIWTLYEFCGIIGRISNVD